MNEYDYKDDPRNLMMYMTIKNQIITFILIMDF
jgi:hypothetical protein